LEKVIAGIEMMTGDDAVKYGFTHYTTVTLTFKGLLGTKKSLGFDPKNPHPF